MSLPNEIGSIYYIDDIDDSDKHNEQIFADVTDSNDVQFRVKVDTGAELNVLPKHIFEKLGENISQLKHSKVTLDTLLQIWGISEQYVIYCKPVHSDKDTNSVLFFIIRHGKMPIWGLRYSLVFKLLKLQQGVYTAPRLNRSVNADEITCDMFPCSVKGTQFNI